MGINIDKFNKWRKETSLDIEVITISCGYREKQTMALTIQGDTEDITRCLVILMNHWDKNKKKKVQHIKEDE
jgi:hypothetical protein